MTDVTIAKISVSAILNNFRRLCRPCDWHLIKADAYGHGFRNVYNILRDLPYGYAMVEQDQALALREEGYGGRILLLSGRTFLRQQHVETCHEYNLTPTVHSTHQLSLLDAAGLKFPEIYLEIDSGMHRYGLDDCDAIGQAFDVVSRYADRVVLMTHFPVADEQSGGVDAQIENFAFLTRHLPSGLPKSLSNSAAAIRYPHLQSDHSRPGLSLYGVSPSSWMGTPQDLGLIPAMSLESELTAVRELQAGGSLSYGFSWTASRFTRVGTFPGGYADGFGRSRGLGVQILVGGQLVHVIGNVCMDSSMCDITDFPELGIGSKVVLWNDRLLVSHIADALGTIPHTLLCATTARTGKILVA